MRIYNTEQKQGESLKHWYRRLAKAADQRLDRLEDYGKQEHYKPALQWAYQRAKRDIATWDKRAGISKELPRFNRAMPKTDEGLMSKISDMRQFLESATSTKEGITAVYEQRAKTINEGRTDPVTGKKIGGYGTNFTWEDMAKFYESEEAKRWNEKFGSKTALRVIATLQKNKEIIMKDMENVKMKNIKVDGKNKRLIKAKVKEALQDNQLDIASLF